MTKNWALTTFFIVLLMAGLIESNTYIQMPRESLSHHPLSKPDSGKAFIYVYRKSLYGALNSFALRKDGRRVGYTNYGHFFRWEVTPGRHRISSEGGDLALVNLHVEAGHSYFVEETVIGGFTIADIRPHLEVVDTARGEQSIKTLRAVL